MYGRLPHEVASLYHTDPQHSAPGMQASAGPHALQMGPSDVGSRLQQLTPQHALAQHLDPISMSQAVTRRHNPHLGHYPDMGHVAPALGALQTSGPLGWQMPPASIMHAMPPLSAAAPYPGLHPAGPPVPSLPHMFPVHLSQQLPVHSSAAPGLHHALAQLAANNPSLLHSPDVMQVLHSYPEPGHPLPSSSLPPSARSAPELALHLQALQAGNPAAAAELQALLMSASTTAGSSTLGHFAHAAAAAAAVPMSMAPRMLQPVPEPMLPAMMSTAMPAATLHMLVAPLPFTAAQHSMALANDIPLRLAPPAPYARGASRSAAALPPLPSTTIPVASASITIPGTAELRAARRERSPPSSSTAPGCKPCLDLSKPPGDASADGNTLQEVPSGSFVATLGAAAEVRPRIKPSSPPVALEACLGVLGSDLSPEMQARIKKRVKIIQPISNTWEAEALGRPDTSGPDTSGSSGQQPELHRPASLEILSEVCDLAAAGGDLPALDDLERVAQQAAAAEVAAADDGQAASPKASAAPAGKALAAGAAEPIAKRRRVGGGRQLSVETDGTEAKRSSRSASPAVAAAGAAKAAVKVQETTAVPAGAAAATTPEPASAVPQPSPRPEQPQSVSPPPEPSREHASLECSERLVTGPAEEDTVMAEADKVAKMEQQEAAAQAAEGTQEQQGSQQAEQHEPQHEPQRTLSQTLMPPPRSSTPAASGRARTSPEPAFAVPKPLSKAGAAGSGSTSGPASAGPSGAGAASVACASVAPRRSGSGVAPGSGPPGDQEACGTAGQLGASVGAMLDSVKPGGGSYGKQWTAGQEQRGPGPLKPPLPPSNSRGSLMAPLGLGIGMGSSSPPSPYPLHGPALHTVHGQLGSLYQWYSSTRHAYLQQAQQLLSLLDAYHHANTSVVSGAPVDTGAVLRAFEKAIQIMQTSTEVEASLGGSPAGGSMVSVEGMALSGPAAAAAAATVAVAAQRSAGTTAQLQQAAAALEVYNLGAGGVAVPYVSPVHSGGRA